MRTRVSVTARLARAAVGLLGISLAGAITTQPGWAAPLDGRSVVTPTSNTTTAAAAVRAAASTSAAARYRWGRAVNGDEFNYKGAPDSRKWRVYNSRGHDGQGWRRRSAWNVDGATVTVTGDAKGTTGGMASLYGQKFGRWEARMKTSLRDPKYHPNILLWPHQRGTTNCPEVNFAESTNNRKLAKFFLHYGCHNKGLTRAKKSIDMTKWHNYAVEWTPTRVTGYLDGKVWFRDSNRKHVPQVAMHATMQLDWMPNNAKTRKTTMSVDWIRVYKL
jgi:hypothetical protein